MSIDQQTLVRVLLRHRSRLLAHIWTVVRDFDVAEDVLQDVSVAVVDHCHGIQDNRTGTVLFLGRVNDPR